MPLPRTVDDADRRGRFRAAFEGHFDYVWLSLRRLGVHERDLEDVAQDLFVQVYGRFDDYDPARPLRPWLFAFAVRCASDWRRLARHRVELLGEPQEHGSTTEGADAGIARAEDVALVHRALDQVDLDRRAVIILYELDDVPMKEIAAALGIPLFTAYSRLRVGREELTAAIRRLLRERGAP
jgi:RNA polymerase sigma-70 factor (ECF subfamily)